MPTSEPNPCGCPDPAEILADLDADLLEMQPGERLWKLYCFRAAGHASGLRHRIYTKRKRDGRLALVTFAVHNPHIARPEENGDPSTHLVRSGIARVPDLSANDLDRIITAVRLQAQGAGAAVTAGTGEEVDLSVFNTLQEQIAWLGEGQCS